ncbi:hypothetical protein, partial [Saccharibacillus qingshengii]|uniref:hypothetical protein n=1 Tax=Saccharibacillus qingshengii TaxID=1763540 RepID=UPI001C1321BA
ILHESGHEPFLYSVRGVALHFTIRRIKTIVEEKLMRFHQKAFSSLLKLVCKSIIAPKTIVHKENLIYFLAYSLKQLQNEYESIISPLVEKDQYEIELLELLHENIEIINHLNESSIDKLIFKLNANLDATEVANRDSWIKIILSSRLQDNKNYYEQISSMLTKFKNASRVNRVRYDFIYNIIINENCNTDFYETLKIKMRKIFILDHYEDNELMKLMIALRDKAQFEHWINVISSNICRWDFNIANKAVYLFKEIDKEIWLELVSNNSKYELVSAIVREALKDGYRSHSCIDLFNELPHSYPELIRGFIEQLFESNGSFKNEKAVIVNLNEKYRDVTISYIKNEEDLVSSVIEKLEEWSYSGDEVDLNYITEKLKL